MTNLTCAGRDASSIFLQWERPRVVYRGVDLYYVYYRSEGRWRFKEVPVGPGDGRTSNVTYYASPLGSR